MRQGRERSGPRAASAPSYGARGRRTGRTRDAAGGAQSSYEGTGARRGERGERRADQRPRRSDKLDSQKERVVTGGGRPQSERPLRTTEPKERQTGFRRSETRTKSFARPNRREVVQQPEEVSREDEVTSQDFIAGRHPVLEALKAGRPINKLLIADTAEGGSLTEIVGKAKGAGIVLQTVPRAHLNKIAGEGHQGVLAYIAPQPYVELEEIIQRETGQNPLVVLLDEVTDPYNFGAILRTSEATGVQGVVIPKRRSVPLTGVVAKASAGAIEYIPVARVSNLVQAIDELKENGYWIVGTAGEAETSFTQVDYTGKIAVVIGAEGKGLGRLVAEKCDFLVKLPMLGKLESLNASVATGVLLYEVVRQRG